MNQKECIYLALFVAVFAFVVWVNANMDVAVWEKTYEREDTRAYGSKMLYDIFPYLIDNKRFVSVDIPPYEVVSDTSLIGTNYLFITQYFQPDDAERDALLKHVARGNVVFVAAEDYGENLTEMLGVNINSVRVTVLPIDSTGIRLADTTRINLLHKPLAKAAGYFYDTDLFRSVFSLYADTTISDTTISDTLQTLTPQPAFLGKFQGGGFNYVKIKYGDGFFLLSSVPLAFTNYNMLNNENAEYVFGALSYLPAQPTFWDRYYKPFKSIPQTPLRFILSAPALRMAYFLLLGAILLFMVTRARRKQRAIPVILPRQNTTVEFAHTIGRLYYNQGDHINLAQKMLDQFKHYVQRQLNLGAEDLDGLPVDRVAARTGLDAEEVAGLISYLKAVDKNKMLDAKSLQTLAGRLDHFYSRSKR